MAHVHVHVGVFYMGIILRAFRSTCQIQSYFKKIEKYSGRIFDRRGRESRSPDLLCILLIYRGRVIFSFQTRDRGEQQDNGQTEGTEEEAEKETAPKAAALFSGYLATDNRENKIDEDYDEDYEDGYPDHLSLQI